MSPRTPPPSPFTRATKVIVVADVVESVRLMALGEQDFIARWHRFVNFAQEQASLHAGRLHKSLGDGLMLEFADEVGCVHAALAMQAWFRDVNQSLQPEEHVHLRIGAHVADVLADQYDIYGNDVNVAARIASLAGPGDFVISSTFRDRLRGALSLHLEDLGDCRLKHVKQPVHAYRVAQAGHTPVLPRQAIDTAGLRASVAVLPFATEGRVVGTSGETLADELVAGLAHSDVLQVVSRMSTATLDAGRDTLQKVVEAVGARYALTGRARVQPQALALFAELADTASGHVVWADSFESVLGPHGLLDGRLRTRVLAALHAAVIAHEVHLAKTRPAPSLEGSTLLLAAIGLMHRLSPLDMEEARRMLDLLLERWRRHPTGHAWMSHLHVLRVQLAGPAFAQHDAARARAHAASAVQADPGSPLVLALEGHAFVHGARNLEAAEERFQQALSLKPRHSLALLFMGEMLALRGDAQAASAISSAARESLWLEPLRYLYDAICALAALAAGDAESALEFALLALRRNPRYLPAWRTLIVAQVETERLAEARTSRQQLLKRQPAFTVHDFSGSTAMNGEFEGRFERALLEAGCPAR